MPKTDTNITFKITVEFYCSNMIDKETFEKDYNSNPMEAYRFISNDFRDSPLNFSDNYKVSKIEAIK